MTAPTKGPWIVLDSTGFYSNRPYTVMAGDRPIGRAIMSARLPALSREEAHANALLFAAAPDLLEACEALDPANKSRTDCNERKCGSCSTCKARAAISKARGES